MQRHKYASVYEVDCFCNCFFASGLANAQASGNFSTQEVLTGYADGYEGDLLYVGFVNGVVSGIFFYNAAAQGKLGNALICYDENVKINASDFVSMIKGDLAKMDDINRQKALQTSFRAVALAKIVKAFPCK